MCDCGRFAMGACKGCSKFICEVHVWQPFTETRDAMGYPLSVWNLLVLEPVVAAQRSPLIAEAARINTAGLHCRQCAVARLEPVAQAHKPSYLVPPDDQGLLQVMYAGDWGDYPPELRDQIVKAAHDKAHRDKSFRKLLYQGVGKRSLGDFPFLREELRSEGGHHSSYGDLPTGTTALEWRSYRLTSDGDVLETHVSKGHYKKLFGRSSDLHEERIVNPTYSLAVAMLLTFVKGSTQFQ